MTTFKEQINSERDNACYYDSSLEAMVELESMKQNGVDFAFVKPYQSFAFFKNEYNVYARYNDTNVLMLSRKKLSLDLLVINICKKTGYMPKTCKIKICSKCGGVGRIKGYEHIDNAICWKCGGTGSSLISI